MFKYRALYGVITYKVIAGNIGDDILKLEDTSCSHFGPNCIISIEKKDGYYEFKESLNESAIEYKFMHTLEPYFAKKEDAIIWKLKSMASDFNDEIKKNGKRVSELITKLKENPSPIVNYVTIDNIDFNTDYFISPYHYESFNVIGRIEYFDGRRGFLTNSNYNDCDSDYYEDRIILFADENGKMRCEKDDFYVFPTPTDYKNYMALKNNEKIEEEIAKLKEAIKKTTRKKLHYANVIKEYETNNISYEKINEMLNEVK